MKPISVLIADDEIHLAKHLRKLVVQLWGECDMCELVHNGQDALMAYHAHQPDIVFLDIHMPVMNGMQVAQALLQSAQDDNKNPPYIIFVTAFDQYAIEAFQQHAFDYLLKPATEDRLARTISRLKKQIAQRGNITPHQLQALLAQLSQVTLPPLSAHTDYLRWIRVLEKRKDEEKVKQIPINEVLYFQACDKYVEVTTFQQSHLVRTTLNELIAKLNPDDFSQIHRSTIINITHLESYHKNMMGHMVVKLKNHTKELPVSRAFQHVFKPM